MKDENEAYIIAITVLTSVLFVSGMLYAFIRRWPVDSKSEAKKISCCMKPKINSKKSKSLEVFKSPFKLVQAPEIEIGIAWRSETQSISFSQSLNKISADID